MAVCRGKTVHISVYPAITLRFAEKTGILVAPSQVLRINFQTASILQPRHQSQPKAHQNAN